MPPRFLIYKGYQGFGDRLQTLLQCIAHARRFNRRLVVDWSDEHWGGTKNNAGGFAAYMTLRGVETAQHPPPYTTSVAPPYWADHPADWGRRVGPWICGAASPSFDIDMSVDHPEEVVICVNCNDRTWDIADMTRHVRFTPPVLAAYAAARARLRGEGPYVAVHLRGTDRGGGTPVARVAEAAKRAGRRARTRALAVVCDDEALAADFDAAVPHAQRVSRRMPASGAVGTHVVGSAALAAVGATKMDMNAGALADFLILAFATEAVGTCSDSTFLHMARAVAGLADKSVLLEA